MAVQGKVWQARQASRGMAVLGQFWHGWAGQVAVWISKRGGIRMVFHWNYNMKVPAQKAGEEIARIEKKYGAVTAETLLEESRHEKALLHPLFEWDDTKAAEKYRLHQATIIICNLRVVREEDENEAHAVRAFVDVSNNEKKGSFIHVVTALENEKTKAIVLNRALMELREFQKKYQGLTELAEVLAAIEKVA